MDNEKRVLLAVILSIAVLYVYQAYLAPPPPPPAAQKQAMEPAGQDAPLGDAAPVPSIPNPDDSGTGYTPSFTQPSGTAPLPATDTDITISSDVFTAVFSESSACIEHMLLHRYKETIPPPAVVTFFKGLFGGSTAKTSPDAGTNYKELITPRDSAFLPLRASVIPRGGASSNSQPQWTTGDTDFSVTGPADRKELSFYTKDSNGISLGKKFYFTGGDYKLDFDLFVKNDSDVPFSGNPLIQWTAPYPEKNGGGFFGSNTGNEHRFSYFINNSVEKKDLKKIEEKVVIEGDILWTAIEEKYFMSAFISESLPPLQLHLGPVNEDYMAYYLIYPEVTLAPGEEASYSFSLFFGPKDIDILEKQGASLEKTVDFGMFDILAKPLLLSLKFFYSFLGNYGLAIILMTVIIKIILWPLTNKSFKSMKEMQAIQPEIAKLKEKYKDNKEEFAKQQMSLYKKYKVNPLGGCLPMLLQIPIFIAFYRALMDSIELRHATFIPFWINDLSAKDPTYVAPLVMGLSMFLQQKMTPTTADPAQAKMMMLMPVVFTVMFLSFPSGLVIYWLVNNVLSIAQQVYINKKTHPPGGTKECAPSKSKQKASKKQSS